MSRKEIKFWDQLQRGSSSLFRVNQGLYSLVKPVGFLGWVHVIDKSLGYRRIPHLHGEAFQVLSGQALTGRKEIEPVISPRHCSGRGCGGRAGKSDWERKSSRT